MDCTQLQDLPQAPSMEVEDGEIAENVLVDDDSQEERIVSGSDKEQIVQECCDEDEHLDEDARDLLELRKELGDFVVDTELVSVKNPSSGAVHYEDHKPKTHTVLKQKFDRTLPGSPYPSSSPARYMPEGARFRFQQNRKRKPGHIASNCPNRMLALTRPYPAPSSMGQARPCPVRVPPSLAPARSYPAQVTAPVVPAQMTSSLTLSGPQQVQSTLVQAVPAPVQAVSAPVQAAPVQAVSAPVQAVPAPVQVVPAPIQVVPAPVQAVPAPVQAATTAEATAVIISKPLPPAAAITATFARNAPQPAETRPNERTVVLFCRNCGKRGHIDRDCFFLHPRRHADHATDGYSQKNYMHPKRYAYEKYSRSSEHQRAIGVSPPVQMIETKKSPSPMITPAQCSSRDKLQQCEQHTQDHVQKRAEEPQKRAEEHVQKPLESPVQKPVETHVKPPVELPIETQMETTVQGPVVQEPMREHMREPAFPPIFATPLLQQITQVQQQYALQGMPQYVTLVIPSSMLVPLLCSPECMRQFGAPMMFGAPQQLQYTQPLPQQPQLLQQQQQQPQFLQQPPPPPQFIQQQPQFQFAPQQYMPGNFSC